VKHRGALGERGLGIEDGRELLVLDRDRARGRVGDLRRVGGDRGDAIADEERVVPAEDGPVLQAAAVASAPVMTARTPSIPRAADASTFTIRACACGLDTNAAWSMFGTRTSAA